MLALIDQPTTRPEQVNSTQREAERTLEPMQRTACIEAAKQYAIAARDLKNGIDAAEPNAF
jgi:hypothetical protein